MPQQPKQPTIQKIKKPVFRIVKNLAPALVDSLKSLSSVNPAFLPLAILIQAVIGYYGDYANDKTMDLFQEFIDNKEKIIESVVMSDEFKASFIKIIGDNITEGNEEKRQYLKNYILNFACGVEKDFNEHTKLITTLNNITLEEIEMLKIWDEGGPIEKWCNEGEPHIQNSRREMTLEVSNIGQIVREKNYTCRLLNFDQVNRDKNNQILLSLAYKGLLWTLGTENFGSGAEAKVKDITGFGKTFLKFIKW